jgi:hypothetical protein
MKKQKANHESPMTQNLISLLSDLENCDRQRMSSSGKEYLDRIWTLLGLPTYDDMIKQSEKLDTMDKEELEHIEKSVPVEPEDLPFQPHPIPNTGDE